MSDERLSTMQNVKRVVCLANSRKLHGRCIAGREWHDTRAGRWIRPVSARDAQDVSEYERQYEDGSDPRVLDIIEIPVLEPKPKDYQTENWLLDPKYYWKKVGRLRWPELKLLTDAVAPLWINGHSTYNGQNDKVPIGAAGSVADSLRLVHVDRIQLVVRNPSEAFGNSKRRVQGCFEHAGHEYALWVTDPQFERTYLAKQDGGYEIGECYLTISLGEPYRGACYKLIAAIIVGDRR